MELEQAERILAQSRGFAYTSMAYTDAEELSAYEPAAVQKEYLLLNGYDPELRSMQCHWAANEQEPWVSALDGFFGVVPFVPPAWVTRMQESGFSVRAAWQDYFMDLTEQPAGIVPGTTFLTPDAYEEAAALTQACRNQSRGFSGQTAAWFAEWLSGAETKNSAVLIERAADGAMKGLLCTGTYAHDSERGAIVWVRELAVLPAYQRQGVGTRLMRQALCYGRAHGAVRAFLAADVCNDAAIALYERTGFRPGKDPAQIDMERVRPLA